MTFPNDPDMPKTPPAPMRGWIKVLLFTSLAVNLAVAGLAIGAVLRHGDMMGHRADRAGQFGGPYTSALSREDRRAIWQQMRSMHGEGRPDRASIRADFAAVVAALRADPYDPGQVRDIVGRQFEAGLALQQAGQALLLDRIEAMSPAERAAFADRLAERLTAWRAGREGMRHLRKD
jgi:uncharacterized membrane protein